MNINPEQICEIAIKAGQKIMHFYDEDLSVSLKNDQSPLTQADMAAHNLIVSQLKKHYPEIPIISEEDSNRSEISNSIFFLVDPLDGTKEFIKKNGEFTVNIALVVEAQPILGVVYAPALKTIYYAKKNLGAFKAQVNHLVMLENQKLINNNVIHNYLRVVASRSHANQDLDNWLAQLQVSYEIRNAGSSLKFCLLAENEADVYPRLGPTAYWDTAAAQCILECAGGVVLNMQSLQPLSYSLNDQLLNPFFIAYKHQNFKLRLA